LIIIIITIINLFKIWIIILILLTNNLLMTWLLLNQIYIWIISDECLLLLRVTFIFNFLRNKFFILRRLNSSLLIIRRYFKLINWFGIILQFLTLLNFIEYLYFFRKHFFVQLVLDSCMNKDYLGQLLQIHYEFIVDHDVYICPIQHVNKFIESLVLLKERYPQFLKTVP